MKTSGLFGVVFLIVSLSSMAASALPKDEIAKLTKSLQATPPPELPARAAEAVKRAKPEDREEVAAVAIRSVAQKRTACLSAVITSVSSAVPAAAPRVVAEAARLMPVQAADWAEIAAKAAPGFSSQIGRTVGRTVSRIAT